MKSTWKWEGKSAYDAGLEDGMEGKLMNAYERSGGYLSSYTNGYREGMRLRALRLDYSTFSPMPRERQFAW